MNDNLTPILRRVQKLLAIANDTRANPAEAAAAAAQAEKIMRKFQIDQADVTQAELLRAENFGEDAVPSALAKRAESWPLWATTLALAVAKLHDCQVRKGYSRATGATIKFVGFKADTQVAAWTYSYLVSCMKRDTKATKERYVRATRRMMDAYRMGYVSALRDSLHEAAEQKRAEMMAESNSRALVVSKEAAVKDRYGEMKAREKDSGLSNVPGFGNGARDGLKVNVTARAVGHDAPDAPLALGMA